MAVYSDSDREAYAKLADFLIPEYNGKPAASAVNVHLEMLDEVLRIRPDLDEGFRRALDFCCGRDVSEALNALAREDDAAFTALTTVTTGGYMMTDGARAAVGYPGQEASPFDVDEIPEYITNGMLDRVIARGPIYRDTKHL
jgi:hypothetical protein